MNLNYNDAEQKTEYVTKKYGEKHAIGIITFNTLGAKQVYSINNCNNLFTILL